MEYNLEGRTLEFSGQIIKVIGKINIDHLNKNIIGQVLRSATSVGANYREANSAISKNDFRNKVYICRKEINETKYWIELLGKTNLEENIKQDLRQLWKESQELCWIFNKICHSLNKGKEKLLQNY